MSFLKEIRDYKETVLKSKAEPLGALMERVSGIKRKPEYFSRALENPGMSIIAEIKMMSPSKGKISRYKKEELARIYSEAPVDCISVLTEDRYFAGDPADINIVKSICSKPVLMKDFIISEYQIYEALLYGADAVLLIVSMLEHDVLRRFVELADELDLAALVEVHSEDELKKCLENRNIRIIGVNSRDLSTLKINSDIQQDLISMIPDNVIKVAESGIDSSQRVKELRDLGYDAVLIGEGIVSSDDPASTIGELKRV